MPAIHCLQGLIKNKFKRLLGLTLPCTEKTPLFMSNKVERELELSHLFVFMLRDFFSNLPKNLKNINVLKYEKPRRMNV